MNRTEVTMTKSELKRFFPWLGTRKEPNGAAVIDQLNAWYESLPTGKASTEWARKLSARRKTHTGGTGGGRPVTLVTCPNCGVTDTKTKMRRHRCTKNLPENVA
jgi:hypothetical protein